MSFPSGGQLGRRKSRSRLGGSENGIRRETSREETVVAWKLVTIMKRLGGEPHIGVLSSSRGLEPYRGA